MTASGTIANAGRIFGGSGTSGGYGTGSAGGRGVDLSSGGLLTNTGLIAGGGGGSGYETDGSGGQGVTLGGEGSVANSGTIAGGGGAGGFHVGGRGAVGLDLAAGGSVTNAGLISGGIAGIGYDEGGFGGAGLNVGGDGHITNSGVILGGSGGAAYFNSGSGGDGVDLASGTLTNTGTISGGAGGAGYSGSNGYGGYGVFLDGGVLINAGTISGGAAGNGAYPAGDAVLFGGAGTLVIDPGAVFHGVVAADAGAADALVLAGASFAVASGTIAGLGTDYTGFSAVTENAGAHWTLDGVNTLATGETLTFAGSLTVAGSLSGGLAVFAPGHHETLAVGAQASVATTLSGFAAGDTIDIAKAATSLTFIAGTLTLYDGASAVETLSLAGNYAQAQFHLSADGHGGANITLGDTDHAAGLSGLASALAPAHTPVAPGAVTSALHAATDEPHPFLAGIFGHHAA